MCGEGKQYLIRSFIDKISPSITAIKPMLKVLTIMLKHSK
jgi:hypothetical protein